VNPIVFVLAFVLIFFSTMLLLIGVMLACRYTRFEPTSSAESMIRYIAVFSAIVAAALASGVSS
jgi:hypothetical protein